MALLLHRTFPIRPLPTSRAFSTTAHRAISLQIEKNDPEALADTVPAYPYGPARWYKQSNRGLYGAQRIQFGNNVGPKFNTKTRRTWHPNIFRKRLYSHALGRFVQVRVAARVLRTIDKLGGLDEYLLGEKEMRVRELGESGWWLRWAIMQTPGVKNKFREEREKLGLPADGIGELEVEAEPGMGEDEAQVVAQSDELVPLDEPVGTDGAFQVEQSPSMKPLKFRVGKGAHLMLTPDGWRRTKPDMERLFKTKVQKKEATFQEYLEKRMEAFTTEFEAAIKKEAVPQGLDGLDVPAKSVDLSDDEMKQVQKEVRRAIRAESKEFLDITWKQYRETVERGKKRRSLRSEVRAKRRVKKARKEGREVNMVDP